MAMNEHQKEAIFNIPNLVSVSRTLFSFVFLFLMIKGKIFGAFIIFLIAASTDFIDGMAARLLNQKTKLGTLLDPMGDKVLMATAYVILTFPRISSPNVIPVWLTATVIGRDLIILIGSIYAYKHLERRAFPPILTGKISTVSQMSVPLLVLFLNVTNRTASLLLWLYLLTFIFTLISGVQYTLLGLKWYSGKKDAKRTR